jgi:hypothetical protein
MPTVLCRIQSLCAAQPSYFLRCPLCRAISRLSPGDARTADHPAYLDSEADQERTWAIR